MRMNKSGIASLTLLPVLISGVFLCGCTEPKTHLQQILERGELRVATRNGPTTYYFEKDKETGLEYELARRFADELHVSLKMVVAKNNPALLKMIKDNKADIAAAALVRSEHNEGFLDFGPGYQWITQNLIYRNRSNIPRSLADISPEKLDLADGIMQPRELLRLRGSFPALQWKLHHDKDVEELLEMLENKEIAYTVINSNEQAVMRHYFPEIRAAFNISVPQPLAWAIKKSDDTSLQNAVDGFFVTMEKEGVLTDLIEYFYGPAEKFDYVDSRAFVKRVTELLPVYKPSFEHAATQTELDWRLLAAVSYQESHWNKKALSPTGVRGLMMLTLNTAKSMGVANRLDPDESIAGGAGYLRALIDKLPERITDPDRTWLALAAYNLGYGHLEDARIITQRQGGDPDNWHNVKERLPLLSKKKWYKNTRHGFARGYEAKHFVRNIRRYYNTLVQLTQPQDESAPDVKLVDALLIDSPVL
jgi:membrane-bound lytic murein transglycosylase F